MQKSIPLIAGQQARISAACKSLLLLSTGAASSVDMQVEFQGQEQPETMGSVTRGFKFRAIDSQVQALVLTASVDCTVVVLISNQNIDFNFNEGSKVTATIDATQLPLQVQPDRGAPGTPVYVSGITYSDAPAVTLQDNAAVAVTDTGAALVAANANRKSLRFTNIGTDPVALGFTGITWAKRCVILDSGDTWIEDRAPNKAWAAITDAGKTASVTTQEVLA